MTTTTWTPAGSCGHQYRTAVCSLPAGHAGPHQAHGDGGQPPEEWLAELEAAAS
jgi:hypothetical protein